MDMNILEAKTSSVKIFVGENFRHFLPTKILTYSILHENISLVNLLIQLAFSINSFFVRYFLELVGSHTL